MRNDNGHQLDILYTTVNSHSLRSKDGHTSVVIAKIYAMSHFVLNILTHLMIMKQ